MYPSYSLELLYASLGRFAVSLLNLLIIVPVHGTCTISFTRETNTEVLVLAKATAGESWASVTAATLALCFLPWPVLKRAQTAALILVSACLTYYIHLSHSLNWAHS
jgi:hypothetical protein